MSNEAPLLVALDLTGTFAFGLNGAMTALRAARLDLVGVGTLGTITVLDAVGLSLFAVTGASKALEFGLGVGQAVILGAVTAVGGGTLRDVLVAQVPTVLRSGLYAVPALIGAAITVATTRAGVYGVAAAFGAAAACFAIRMVGVRYGLNAPRPPGASE
jgi:uncharacterized membrane protein YeiH